MQQVTGIQKCFQRLCSSVAVTFPDSITEFAHSEPIFSCDIETRSTNAAVIQMRSFRKAGCFESIVVSRLANCQQPLSTRAHSCPRVRYRPLCLQFQGAGRKFAKFPAEAPQARSANLVSEINTNEGSQRAARFTINQKTEQHRCTAVNQREDLNHG
jgi:hypothetical protein